MTIERVAVIFDNTLRPETTGIYCRRALGELVEVEHFLPNQLEQIPRGRFDLYLSVDDGLDYAVPDNLHPSAFWAIDTHIEFERSLRKARRCDFTFAAQKDGAERLREAGIAGATWLPLACDPLLHGKQPVEKRYDVGFVGNVLSGPRADLLRTIQAEFPESFVGNCYFEQMAAAYSASRIVFNRSVANDVNMRIFEALCSGSLLVTNDLAENGQAEMFQNGVHLVTYDNDRQLLEVIRRCLADEPERERIAAAGREEVLAKHTYRHRMQTVLGTVAPGPARPVISVAVRPPKAAHYFEFARPEVLALVPKTARNVLDIGCGAGRLGVSIKERQGARVVGVELNPQAAETARVRLDEVVVGNLEEDEVDFSPRSFDCVICADVLEHLRSPRDLLRKVAGWIAPGGTLVASLPNVRHHTVVQSLLDGNFTYEPAGLLDEDHVRLFTRREIEKLVFRAGFVLDGIDVVPGPGHAEWVERGRPGSVQAGRLQINGLEPADAEEFYAYQYLVTATPATLIASGPDQSARIRALADSVAWPEAKPDVPIPHEHVGWLADGARQQLTEAIGAGTRLVLELGSWLGLSTRFIAERAPQATVVCVDHWQGNTEHRAKPEWRRLLPALYKTFLAMCWEQRRQIIPLKMTTQEGLRRVAAAGLRPDVIYFDAEHSDERVMADLETCRRLFPESLLVGDDYDDPGVRRAVDEFARRHQLTVETSGTMWRGWRLQSAQLRAPVIPEFRPAPGLTSIVLVTHNQLGFTQACLESIRFVTDEPYELILVDNASTDGTVELLCSLEDVRLIENAQNRGFPAAANQGIQVAKGDNVLLLNNDTVVTTGWLRRLLTALHSDPSIGLVGPCSNSVSGPQQVSISYTDLSGLDGFAWQWGKKHDRRTVDVERLVGFCLLFKRAVLDQIGLLDEQFGIGNFEDDDYCRRAIDAGFRCVIAWDAFIHHFGGATFSATGVDFAGLMAENQQKFAAKWQMARITDKAVRPTKGANLGPNLPDGVLSKSEATDFAIRISAGGDLLLERKPANSHPSVPNIAAPVVRSAPPVGQSTDRSPRSLAKANSPASGSRLSLCMIVRDNENTIRACLESIKPWVDEMIVVDTGSKDATPKIAAELGAHVYEFPWCDDFSAARNESLKYARGEWIFWMDSDDTILAACGRKLRELADGHHPENVLGYVVQVHCPGPGEEGQLDVTAVDHVKLFRNRPELRFEFRIHEQILPAIRRAGGEVAFTDIYVVHSGSDHSEKGRAGKFRRDFRILAKDFAERPDHPFVLFNLGMTYADAGRHDKAIAHLRRCIAVSSEGESHVRKAYALLVSSLAQADRHDDAWDSCQEGLRHFPQDAELLFRSGLLHQHFGRLGEAEQVYQQVLDGPKDRHFASLDIGIDGYKARHNLAAVYEELQRPDAAERQWRAVIEECPNYRLGWRGLGRTLMAQTKYDEAAALATQLVDVSSGGSPRLRCEGWMIRAAVARRRGNVVQALQFLEDACRQFPDDLDPLRDLCELLFTFRPGNDALEALARLAERDPSDGSAPHNLGTLHFAAGRLEPAIAAYRESLCRRPKSVVTERQLGLSLRNVGQFDSAAAAFRRALQIDPEDCAARTALEEMMTQ